MSDLNQNKDCLESAFEYHYIICKIENALYKFITTTKASVKIISEQRR